MCSAGTRVLITSSHDLERLQLSCLSAVPIKLLMRLCIIVTILLTQHCPTAYKGPCPQYLLSSIPHILHTFTVDYRDELNKQELSLCIATPHPSVYSPCIMNENAHQCQTCLTIKVRRKTVSCHTCKRFHHRSCVGLTRVQAENINRWLCSNCLGRNITNTTEDQADFDLGEYLSQCFSNTTALRIIPRGAIICAADALHRLLDQAAREKSLLSWGKLLSFGRIGLKQPSSGHEESKSDVSLTTLVKRQIQAFMEAESLVAPKRNKHRGGSAPGSDQRLKRGVSAKFSDGDIKGAIRLLTSTESIAPRNDETLNLLKQKHPSTPENLTLPAPPTEDMPAPAVARVEDVRKALASFRPGSAGGPDGIRPGHLVALTSRKSGEAGVRLLGSLTEFVNLVLGGEVPEFARSVFYGASLTALGKKDGGVRPIAVGSTLRRLATKVGAKPLSSKIGDNLRPSQLGYSTPGGCEAAAHAARRYIGEASHRRVLFKIDMANAFNCLRRDVFLSAAREKAPEIYRLLWQAYSAPSTLFYGDTNLSSESGIQQGDPFGPALFSLGIDRLIQGLNCELNIWYLDDGSIGDSPEKVLSCVEKLIRDLNEIGLVVNQSKCELIILHHSEEEALRTEKSFRDMIPGLKVVQQSDCSLLGAPLADAGISATMREKVGDLERMSSRLELVESHQAFVLLKNCFALPKVQYILRSSPVYKQVEELDRFDQTLISALSSITNVRFEGESLEQAVLPVRLGGLGIRLSKHIALPSFVSSLHSVRDLVDAILQNVSLADDSSLQTAVEAWRDKIPGIALPENADLGSQKTWDRPLSESSAAKLLERADQVSRARLLAASSRESGLWLHALPSPALGTLLDSESFRVSVALRVGAFVCKPHTCRCGQAMDAKGLHGLSCKYSAGRHPRHAALNDVVRRALQSAGVPSILEPVGVDRGDGKRPDGITVFPFANGRCLCWDATCTDTFAMSHLNSSAVSVGSAAGAAEESKRRKYASLAARFRFEPVAVETAGTFGGSTGSFIAEIGRRISEITGDRRETYWLEQRIGLAVQRGNALSILTAIKDRFDRNGPL